MLMEAPGLKICVQCGTICGEEIEICPKCVYKDFRSMTIDEIKKMHQSGVVVVGYFRKWPRWPTGPNSWDSARSTKETLEITKR